MNKRSKPAAEGYVEIAEAPPKLLEARQHGKTVLECSANGSPSPLITWYKDGRPLLQAQQQRQVLQTPGGQFGLQSMGETKSRISLDCVDESDAGLYECVAVANGAKTTVATQVRVASFEGTGDGCKHLNFLGAAPKINQWIGTYLQPIGNDAHLICRSEGVHDTYWIGPTEQEITPNENGRYKIMDNGDLLITDLSFDDMGIFKCVVNNEYGEDRAETFVYPHAG